MPYFLLLTVSTEYASILLFGLTFIAPRAKYLYFGPTASASNNISSAASIFPLRRVYFAYSFPCSVLVIYQYPFLKYGSDSSACLILPRISSYSFFCRGSVCFILSV